MKNLFATLMAFILPLLAMQASAAERVVDTQSNVDLVQVEVLDKSGNVIGAEFQAVNRNGYSVDVAIKMKESKNLSDVLSKTIVVVAPNARESLGSLTLIDTSAEGTWNIEWSVRKHQEPGGMNPTNPPSSNSPNTTPTTTPTMKPNTTPNSTPNTKPSTHPENSPTSDAMTPEPQTQAAEEEVLNTLDQVDLIQVRKFDVEGNELGADIFALNRQTYPIEVTIRLTKSDNVTNSLTNRWVSVTPGSRGFLGSVLLKDQSKPGSWYFEWKIRKVDTTQPSQEKTQPSTTPTTIPAKG